MSEKRQPWMKWYPADWRDPRLRLCSLAARGLWADMLSYMHEGEPYGHLTIAGVRVETDDLAKLVGQPLGDVKRALAELEAKSVFSRTDSGAIYSRRMVRDKAKSDADKENGKGGGNPKLLGKDKPGVNPPDNGQDKAQKPEARDQRPEEESGFKIPLPDLRASRASPGPRGTTPEGRRELWRGKVTRYVTAHAPPDELEEFAREVAANTPRGRELLDRWDRVMRRTA